METAHTPKGDIKSLTQQQLEQVMASLGQPSYRAGQVFTWLHQRQVDSFAQMSDLPASLREQLQRGFAINTINLLKKLESQVDGTVKYLYELADGNCVESVRMQYRYGVSLCISTQVGCRMGCRFCASTIGGLVRGLTAAEMLDQVYATQRESGQRVRSIVLMGIGEPLDNLDQVVAFLRILSSPKGLNLGLRHVTLSTCGVVDGIRELAQHRLPITLSVSLHAPSDQLRSEMMPINRKWNIAKLLEACREYFAVTGRRVTFEYALIQGVNDQPQHAKQLVGLLGGYPTHVNLIPVNAVQERGYSPPVAAQVAKFQRILEQGGIPATVRRELGADISGACGQLRRDNIALEGGH